jgi:uncharacterized protein GlcG (DUF336 family)
MLVAMQVALQAASAIGLQPTVAICDAGGHLRVLYRDPRALLASLESAQSKARTAVYFGVESRLLPAQAPITPALLAAASVPLAFLPGGIPLRDRQGQLCGAVGVGGGTPEQDQAMAEAVVRAWLDSSLPEEAEASGAGHSTTASREGLGSIN